MQSGDAIDDAATVAGDFANPLFEAVLRFLRPRQFLFVICDLKIEVQHLNQIH